MKNEALKETLRLITKVLIDSRVGPGQRDRLERAKRELMAVARSGKLEKEKVFRAVAIVAKVLSEVVGRDNP